MIPKYIIKKYLFTPVILLGLLVNWTVICIKLQQLLYS